jgi:ABC-type glycerol-3-phosphate transport system substrate-binding protein
VLVCASAWELGCQSKGAEEILARFSRELRDRGLRSEVAATAQPATVEWIAGLSQLQISTHQSVLVEPFQQAHPRLRLSLTNSALGVTQLATLLAAGTPPDVVYPGGPRFFLAGMNRDVSSLVRRDRYNVAGFAREPFEWSCTWRGAIVCLPLQYGGNWPVMPYNRDLLREAGVPEPPTRWGDPAWGADAWLRALQKTTRLGAAGGKAAAYGVNQPNRPLVTNWWPAQWKAAWITDDLTTITSDSPPMIEAFEYLVGLVTRHRVMATDADLKEAFGDDNPEKVFLAGKLAMYHTRGAQTVINVGQAVRDHGLPLAYAPLPTFKGFGATHTFENNGLIVGARQPEAGWTLMKWLADTPNWSVSRGNLPARIENFDAWAQGLYKGIESRVRLEVYRDSLRYTVKPDRVTFLPSSEQMANDVIGPAFDRLWAGQANVAATLREIKAPLQALVPNDLGR